MSKAENSATNILHAIFSKLTINLTEQNWPDIAAAGVTAAGKIRPHIFTSKNVTKKSCRDNNFC